MINLKINELNIEINSGATILEAAVAAGVEIPTLCHGDGLHPYGACGICLVEVENSPRPVRACVTPVVDGMSVHTETARIQELRKFTLELLLSDHSGDCLPPCSLNCPARTDCQGYVRHIAKGEITQAVELIKERLPLPSSIGRVCPRPCEEACRRQLVEEPISIAKLKFFASDKDLFSDAPFVPEILPQTGKSVAIVGGGPGGLSAAYFLKKKGHSVVVFDAMPEMGGMLRYGIPEYRLPKNILAAEIDLIARMGVEMKNNVRIGSDVSLSELRNKFDAVIIAAGAWKSVPLGCVGEALPDVVGGIDFLRNSAMKRISSYEGKNVAVVGGGNTAMDACRTAVRLGCKNVYVIYRRTKDEMPADAEEIEDAIEEGVEFKFLTNPVEIIGDNDGVSTVKLQKMALGEPDESGRRSPVPIEGEFEIIDVDQVIIAIGQTFDFVGFEELSLTKKKTIFADENDFSTNLTDVFAVGDATNAGASIAIAAIGEAQRAASVVDCRLRGNMLPKFDPMFSSKSLVRQEKTSEDFKDIKRISRVKTAVLGCEEAAAEAKRCLECGCHDFFECRLIKYSQKYGAAQGVFEGIKNVSPIKPNDHPNILRDNNKCILCGLCVRVCGEIEGLHAVGLANRGFDTSVVPAGDRPLAESGCNFCGKCVELCPTGALKLL